MPPKGYRLTEEQKKKISLGMLGHQNALGNKNAVGHICPNRGKHLPESTKQKLSASLKGKNVGKVRTQEFKDNVSLRHSGERSHFWGGGFKRSHGYLYRMCKEHPRAGKDGYVPEHILVWEKIYNKPLPNGHIIHHLNGIKDDNRGTNLIAVSRKEHHKMRIPYQQRIRELEAELVRIKQLNMFQFEE